MNLCVADAIATTLVLDVMFKMETHKVIKDINLSRKNEEIMTIINKYASDKISLKQAPEDILLLHENSMNLIHDLKRKLLLRLMIDYLYLFHPQSDGKFELCTR